MTLAACKNPPVRAHLDHPVVGFPPTEGAEPFAPLFLVDSVEGVSSPHVEKGPKKAAPDQDLGIVGIQ